MRPGEFDGTLETFARHLHPDDADRAREAIRAVHDQGGVAIAAHPMPGSWTTKDDEALRLMDGDEVAHPGVIRASRAQRLLLDSVHVPCPHPRFR